MTRREQAEAIMAALDVRDFDALADFPLHPEMEFHSRFAGAEGAVFRGLEGLREWAATVDETWEGFSSRLEDFVEVDETRAQVTVSAKGVAKLSGAPLEERIGHIWTWKDGKLWRVVVFPTVQDAREAAGLDARARHGPVEVVLGIFDAINRGDVDGAVACTARDVVIDFSRSTSPYRGVYEGQAQVRRFWSAWLRDWERLEWNAEDVEELADGRVALVNHLRCVGRGSGIEIDGRGGHIWEVSDGVVTRMTLFQDKAAALEAAQSEPAL